MAHILLGAALWDSLEAQISTGAGTVKLRSGESGSWIIEAELDDRCEPPLRIAFRGKDAYDLAVAFLLSLGEKLCEPT